MYFAQTNNSLYMYIDANNICSLLVLLYSSQVEWCRIYNAKITRHGKDLVEAKVLATEKAEKEGLLYICEWVSTLFGVYYVASEAPNSRL